MSDVLQPRWAAALAAAVIIAAIGACSALLATGHAQPQALSSVLGPALATATALIAAGKGHQAAVAADQAAGAAADNTAAIADVRHLVNGGLEQRIRAALELPTDLAPYTTVQGGHHAPSQPENGSVREEPPQAARPPQALMAPSQFYLELPGGQVVAEAVGDGGVSLYYSGRGGFRLDAEQAAQLHDWLAAVAEAAANPAPDAADTAAAVATPAAPQLQVHDGGQSTPTADAPAVAPEAPSAPAAASPDTQLTPDEIVRLRALLNPVSEIKPEG